MNGSLLAAVLFGIGMYGVLTRRDVVGVLVALEVMLGAANLQLVTLSAASAGSERGEATALLIMVLAAAEAAVGLALLLAVWRRSGRTRTDELQDLGG